MSMQAKLKARGIFLLATFFVLLAVIFMPVFPGDNGRTNGLELYGQPVQYDLQGFILFHQGILKKNEKFVGKQIDVKVKMDDEKQAAETAKLLEVNGAKVTSDRQGSGL